MTKKKKKHNYVDNKKFYECIVQYKIKVREAEEKGLPKPRIPEYAGECIKLIAANIAKYNYKFARYSYNDEMESDAIMNCIRYFDNFDETKYTNPHAYFTTVCFQANIHRIKLEKTQQYIKYKSFERVVTSGDLEYMGDDDSGSINPELYENISTFIDDYEKKEEEKREKRREKLQERKMKDSLDRFMEDKEEENEQE